MNRKSVLCEALKLYKAGYSVLPVKADGSKSPWYAWKPYKESRLTEGKLFELINNRSCGLSVLGGESSGGLECLDFDRHKADDPDLFTKFKERSKSLLDGLPIVSSPSNGVKVFWRYNPSYHKQSLPLAVSSDGTSTLIELLSGKINLVPNGDPKAHKSGKPYTYLQGHLVDTPVIGLCRRCELISLAESLSIGIVRKDVPKLEFDEHVEVKVTGSFFYHSLWSALTSWDDLLEPFGWSYEGGGRWCRPDKDNGTSGQSSDYVFTCYSSNAQPLTQRSYNKYELLRTLFFNGDTEKTNKYVYGKVGHLIDYVHPVCLESKSFLERELL